VAYRSGENSLKGENVGEENRESGGVNQKA
jgi:hypothetical protein